MLWAKKVVFLLGDLLTYGILAKKIGDLNPTENLFKANKAFQNLIGRLSNAYIDFGKQIH